MSLADDARSWSLGLCKSEPANSDTVAKLGTGWSYEVKWDGIRCMAIIDRNHVVLINRRGTEITYRYPEVCANLGLLSSTNTEPIVLDGEIVVPDPQTGTPMFKWAHQRDAFGPGRAKDISRWADSHPATYMAFDLLAWQVDKRKNDLASRQAWLEQLVAPFKNGRLQTGMISADGAAMLAIVKQMNLEGLVAKRQSAPYPRGRSSAWIKMKPVRTVTAFVTGWEAGTGWRAEYFGALRIAVYDENGGVVDLGKVGTGFNTNDLNLMDPLVKASHEPPFLCVEVEFAERQPGTGVLRFPSFKGMRHDRTPSDCSTEQFEEGRS